MEAAQKPKKEDRIAARAARIAAKKNKDDPSSKGSLPGKGKPGSANGTGNSASATLSSVGGIADEVEREKNSQTKKQITFSRQNVDDTKANASDHVTSISLQRYATESERRAKEESKRAERLATLQQELLNSQEQNKAIEDHWEEVAKKNIPQELYAEIAAQYKKASSILAQKDALIKSLQNELNEKEEQYVELLAQHQEDINEILIRMKQTFQDFLKCCTNELNNIENSFMTERTQLLEKCKEDLDLLFERRRKMELHIMEQKHLREKKFQQELSEIRNRDAEDYTSLKIDLETSIQLFEQQLEEMRATYQLNSEKLEYNHAVLMERDIENKATVEHHRIKLRRLKEALSALITKFHLSDKKFKQENNELSNEYRRMTSQFKDLQKKYAHFVQQDVKKYNSVWSMNEQHVMHLVKKVLCADKIIHNQILGLEWTLPLKDGEKYKYFDVTNLTSQHIFQNAININENEDSLNPNNNGSGGNGNGNSSSNDNNANGASGNGDGSDALKSHYSSEQIKYVLDLLSGEVNYFLDSRLTENDYFVMQAVDEREKNMYKADAILHALGVEDREDLEELVKCFFEDPLSDKPTVHPNDVTRVVREFVQKRQNQKNGGAAASSSSSSSSTTGTTSTDGSGGGGGKSSSELLSVEKSHRKKEREKQFWQRLSNVLPGTTLSLWNNLEEWQKKYNTLLEERAILIDETTELAKQNEELKILLQEYLGSKVNRELHIPPTRLIRVQQNNQ